MGTTLTAVYVGARGGRDRPRRRQPRLPPARRRAARLTDDHSLVDELHAPGQAHARGGRRAPAALDHHARARARAGGRGRHALLQRPRGRRLPAVQRRAHVDGRRGSASARSCAAHPSLRDAGEALIAAANEAGGRDNITVVLFRLEERLGAGERRSAPATEEQTALAPVRRRRSRPAEPRPRERARAALAPPPLAPDAMAARRSPASARATAGAPAPAERRASAAGRTAPTQAPAPRGAGASCWSCSGCSPPAPTWRSQSVYFIGTNSRGLVTIYQRPALQAAGRHQAVQQRLRLGRRAPRRCRPRAGTTLLDHSLRSEGDAAASIRSLELGQLRGRREQADRPPVRARRRCCSRCWSRSPRAGRSSKPASLRAEPRSTTRALLEQERIQRGSDPRRRRDGARAQRPRRAKAPTGATYPTGDAVRPAGRLLLHRPRPVGHRALPQRGARRRSQRQQPAGDPRPAPGQAPAGDEVITTLDPAAQRVARSRRSREHRRRGRRARPAHRRGRGDGLQPELRPQPLRSSSAYERLTRDSDGTPLVNRATQFGYAPGSTFKVVTATAAIDTGAVHARSRSSAARDGITRLGACRWPTTTHESYGQITLTEALAKSVNTVYAQVAEHVGKPDARRATWSRFGFDSQAPARLSGRTRCRASGEYSAQRLLAPTSRLRRRRAHGHRPGQTRGRRRCRWRGRRRRRQRRAADGPAPDRPDRRPRRAHRRSGSRRALQSVVMKPSTAAARDRDDGSRRHAKAPAPRRRSPASGRRQDRAPPRRRSATADQQRLVHRLRARRRIRAWRSP